jgi:hypothetical protein
MTDKRTLGLAKFKELSPAGAEKIKDLLEDTAPGTYTHVLEVAFAVLRGTAVVTSASSGYLWTRGYIPRLRTYPGREVRTL